MTLEEVFAFRRLSVEFFQSNLPVLDSGISILLFSASQTFEIFSFYLATKDLENRPLVALEVWSTKPSNKNTNSFVFIIQLFLVPSVPGILARDSKTIIMLCKLLLDDGYIRRNFDPDLLPIPWNEQVRNYSSFFPYEYLSILESST